MTARPKRALAARKRLGSFFHLMNFLPKRIVLLGFLKDLHSALLMSPIYRYV